MDDLVPGPAHPLLWFLVLRVRRRRWRRAKQFVDDLTG
jgi:hypothetical protein